MFSFLWGNCTSASSTTTPRERTQCRGQDKQVHYLVVAATCYYEYIRDNYVCVFSERNQSGRYRCTVAVADKGIKTTAEANLPKTAKAAAARAALRKLNTLC